MELYKLKISKASLDRYDVECKSDSSEMKKEFDDLIHEFLTDGFIDEKERSVLIKKAQKLGIDPDEADLYITAQQQKYDNVIDSAKEKEKGKKCPHCYKPVHELTDLCPYCFEPMTPKASKELEDILDNLEIALVDLKTGTNISHNMAIVERYIRKARIYGSNPKIQDILFEIENETSVLRRSKVREQKKNAVQLFFAWVGLILIVLAAIVVVGYFVYRTKSAEWPALWAFGGIWFAAIFYQAIAGYFRAVIADKINKTDNKIVDYKNKRK